MTVRPRRVVPMLLSNIERSQKLPLEWIYLSKILYQHQSSFKGAANSQSFPWNMPSRLNKSYENKESLFDGVRKNEELRRETMN